MIIGQTGHGKQRTARIVTLFPAGLTPDGVTRAAPSDVTPTPRKRHYKPRARRCKTCGQEFTPARKSARFCSHKCRQAAYRRKQPRAPKEAAALYQQTCDQCGVGFFSTKTSTRYCGKACKQAAYEARRSAAVEALAADMDMSGSEAADLIEQLGMKKIAPYLRTRGYEFDVHGRVWGIAVQVGDVFAQVEG